MSSSPPRVFVILLNWNGKEDTLACLKSLENVSTPHQVIVVDNGSSDDSISSFQKNFPNVLLIENRDNLGFAEGNNIGIRRALSLGAEYLFLLNNDTIVDPSILEGFLKMIKHNPNASILGGRVYLMKDPTRLDHLGGIWNLKRGEFDLIASHALDGEKWDLSLPVDFVSGCSLFAKAEVFREVGELDPRYFLYWEESDFCFRAKKKGFSTFYCPQAKLWHKVSSSFVGGKPHTSYFWWRNRFLWIEKNVDSKLHSFAKTAIFAISKNRFFQPCVPTLSSKSFLRSV
ncbi:MAG: glycosyltransferase family 2 protein [Simkania negevensis]|nr:glycosyltransferase family 2 protein [Simkania negevensis]